jgi:hypothetical protein
MVKSIVVWLMLSFLFAPLVLGQNDTIPDDKEVKKKLSMKDPVDGAFDISSFLLENKGVLPVVFPITEPAVGYGAALPILYFHHRKKKYSSYVPPNISGIVGLYTENKTWGGGAFHMHTFGENRVRTITALMKVNVNYKYYGNNNPLLNQYPPTVKMNSWLFFQRAQVRLGESQFYMGASYTFLKSDISLDTVPGKPLLNYFIKRLRGSSVISTIKPMIVYDNRDNVFTPTSGYSAELSLNYSGKWLGASENYMTLHTNFYGYVPILPKLFSGWRFNGSYVIGEAPFYAYPFVQLRGIAAMRYQSDNVLVAETEWRYNVYKRWSLIGFSGVGKAFHDFDSFSDIDLSYNFGTGFRYKLARLLGVHMGTDFAWGNGKDFAFYIVFGSSW